MNFGRTTGIDGWGIERSAGELGGRRNKGERVEMVGKSREAGGRSSGGGDREGGGDALVKGEMWMRWDWREISVQGRDGEQEVGVGCWMTVGRGIRE